MSFEILAEKIWPVIVMIFSVAMMRLIAPSMTKFCWRRGRELVESDEPPTNLDNSG